MIDFDATSLKVIEPENILKFFQKKSNVFENDQKTIRP
jgi:hypothetical protein